MTKAIFYIILCEYAYISLIPRPLPSLTVLQVMGSWARAWKPYCKRREAGQGPGNCTANDGKLGEGLET